MRSLTIFFRGCQGTSKANEDGFRSSHRKDRSRTPNVSLPSIALLMVLSFEHDSNGFATWLLRAQILPFQHNNTFSVGLWNCVRASKGDWMHTWTSTRCPECGHDCDTSCWTVLSSMCETNARCCLSTRHVRTRTQELSLLT